MAINFPLGAHLVSPRTLYSHHGIYIGNGRVIHYSGLANDIESGPVEITSLEDFCAGNEISVKTYKNAYSTDEILRRAMSRVGESSYSVFNNNCEHFCLWCITGSHTSTQVDSVTTVSGPAAGSMAGFAARGVVAASGSVVGLSGAGVMSGLASTGAIVGGGAVTGLAILGAAPGAAMASLVNNTVLADDPNLDTGERDSRAVGRVASYAGAAAGTAGSIAAVSAMGTTAGLSAAGITSGLAAIGGTVGGGMAAGVMVATAAPVAAAAAVGYGIYKFVRWVKD
ncbi:MAG: lecithin retinol acyltransferase family protein [Proteobacteria bacterium]|nr:lecithin retinol acyltransferase family protein [Pseudomonadota bacterium]